MTPAFELGKEDKILKTCPPIFYICAYFSMVHDSFEH
jgi:hypothetical protein